MDKHGIREGSPTPEPRHRPSRTPGSSSAHGLSKGRPRARTTRNPTSHLNSHGSRRERQGPRSPWRTRPSFPSAHTDVRQGRLRRRQQRVAARAQTLITRMAAFKYHRRHGVSSAEPPASTERPQL
ncbi:hypothetical protein BC827DRAFT_178053 [Russula dissimulans]|nr:hypothetical protein BC827DRAFT_178053 [Russula dissimulans]